MRLLLYLLFQLILVHCAIAQIKMHEVYIGHNNVNEVVYNREAWVALKGPLDSLITQKESLEEFYTNEGITIANESSTYFYLKRISDSHIFFSFNASPHIDSALLEKLFFTSSLDSCCIYRIVKETHSTVFAKIDKSISGIDLFQTISVKETNSQEIKVAYALVDGQNKSNYYSYDTVNKVYFYPTFDKSKVFTLRKVNK